MFTEKTKVVMLIMWSKRTIWFDWQPGRFMNLHFLKLTYSSLSICSNWKGNGLCNVVIAGIAPDSFARLVFVPELLIWTFHEGPACLIHNFSKIPASSSVNSAANSLNIPGCSSAGLADLLLSILSSVPLSALHQQLGCQDAHYFLMVHIPFLYFSS